MTAGLRDGSVSANGINFAYLEAGEGPLVLLLHGFPDNAWTWEHQLGVLSGSGYRAVAPFLRGYPPTDVPINPVDTEVVAHDVGALIEALGENTAFVVGHDWGALAAFNAAALYPDSVRRAVSIGAGHPATAIEIFSSPALLHYAFHIWLFQLEGFAELAVRDSDFALIDYLWHHWSSQPVDEAHVKGVKKTLNEPGAVEAALGYYRSLVRIPSEKPAFFERITQPTVVPMMVLFGDDDPVREISDAEERFFAAEYRREVVSGAGHFVHRERPEETSRLILEWLAEPRFPD